MSVVSRLSALRVLPLLIVIAVPAILVGCADSKDVYVERPVETLYNAAMDDLINENYAKSAKEFDEVERQHPYSVWASKAQLMAAYAHYQHNKFDDAISSLDRFIQLHPSHKDVAYAYYLKAICYYEQIADVQRDQKGTDDAMKALQEVVTRFPSTAYASDAKFKIDLARDHLAGHEMVIGRWYQGQQLYAAAIGRFQRVVDDYQTTNHVPEALHRLTEVYLTLGLKEQARKTASVLGYNYPGSQWYEDSWNDLVDDSLVNEPGASTVGTPPPRGFFSRAWHSVF